MTAAAVDKHDESARIRLGQDEDGAAGNMTFFS
jgi:hypothetical protein